MCRHLWMGEWTYIQYIHGWVYIQDMDACRCGPCRAMISSGCLGSGLAGSGRWRTAASVAVRGGMCLCACMYTHPSVHMWVHMRACIHVRVESHPCIHACRSIHTCLCAHQYMHTCTHIHTSIHVYTSIHIWMDTHTCIHRELQGSAGACRWHVCVYVHMHI